MCFSYAVESQDQREGSMKEEKKDDENQNFRLGHSTVLYCTVLFAYTFAFAFAFRQSPPFFELAHYPRLPVPQNGHGLFRFV